ncbi:MAG: sigma-70 family RNA polymerase sigma factor [Gammaproteobacteria bacterium]|nr:sigma-70 family RNA polymerase sigma factor [Gammaproteobacteria bacterium]
MAYEGDIPNRVLGWVTSEEPDWDAVYREQLPRVYNFFRYRFGDDAVAEDLTSRTFEKAWAARRRYRRDVAGFATWLLSIARNVATDHLRAQRRQVPLEYAEDVISEGTPEEEHSQRSDLVRLSTLIEALPKREQELIALKYGAGATNRDIAGLTGLSESNVGSILHRAVKALRRQW